MVRLLDIFNQIQIYSIWRFITVTSSLVHVGNMYVIQENQWNTLHLHAPALVTGLLIAVAIGVALGVFLGGLLLVLVAMHNKR